VLGQRPQVRGLGAREPGGGAQLVGVLGEDLLRCRLAAVVPREQALVDRACECVETCWPTIERTSAP
jgi:hypothetical protein